MTSLFTVRTTSSFERLARRLARDGAEHDLGELEHLRLLVLPVLRLLDVDAEQRQVRVVLASR